MKVTHSLRGRLLWFLLAAISIAAIAQATIAYRTALGDADQIFDYHMQQMALALGSSAPLSNVQARRGGIDADAENNELVVQVWTPDGVQVFRTVSRAQLPQRAVPLSGFSRCRPAARRCRWPRTWRCAATWPATWRCARSARSRC